MHPLPWVATKWSPAVLAKVVVNSWILNKVISKLEMWHLIQSSASGRFGRQSQKSLVGARHLEMV